MNIQYTTIGTTEPVSLSEMKTFLGEAGDHNDALITALITAARERAEIFLNRTIVDRRIVLMIDYVPVNGKVKLPRGPIKELVSVQYVDNDDDLQTLDPENYASHIGVDPGILVFKNSISGKKQGINTIHITYDTGYGNREVYGTVYQNPLPGAIVNAIKMIVYTMYDHRDDIVRGTIVTQLPQNAEYLLSPHRIFEFL